MLELHVLKAGHGFVLEHGRIEVFVHSSLRVANDQDEDLIDELGHLELELARSCCEPFILFHVMQKQCSVRHPERQHCHVPLMFLYHIVDLSHGCYKKNTQEVFVGVVVGVSGSQE